MECIHWYDSFFVAMMHIDSPLVGSFRGFDTGSQWRRMACDNWSYISETSSVVYQWHSAS